MHRKLSSSLAQVGPLSEYLSRISRLQLKPNQDQYRAIVKLEKLHLKCLDYQPQSWIYKRDSKLVKGAQQEGLILSESLKIDERIKGIWLNGSVG